MPEKESYDEQNKPDEKEEKESEEEEKPEEEAKQAAAGAGVIADEKPEGKADDIGKCPSCGESVARDWKHCPSCNKPLPVKDMSAENKDGEESEEEPSAEKEGERPSGGEKKDDGSLDDLIKDLKADKV